MKPDITELLALLEKFSGIHALVIGDSMLDTYIQGDVNRISPEAPVPVVLQHNTDYRAGGAANVALNLKSLGANVFICSVCGKDEAGKQLKNVLHTAGIDTTLLLEDAGRKTTTKTRIIGNKHQMLRIDSEDTFALDIPILQQFLLQTEQLIQSKKIQVAVLEDYDKGMLNTESIPAILQLLKKYNIPVVVDPKKDAFFSYTGVALFKPNLKELNESMHTNVAKDDFDKLTRTTQDLLQKINAVKVMITLSENGVFMHSQTDSCRYKAHPRQVADVSGAGDTVISVAALCEALNINIHETAYLANMAGGLVCEKTGVVPIDKEELKAALTQMLSRK